VIREAWQASYQHAFIFETNNISFVYLFFAYACSAPMQVMDIMGNPK
jgi:hypothetical protein